MHIIDRKAAGLSKIKQYEIHFDGFQDLEKALDDYEQKTTSRNTGRHDYNDPDFCKYSWDEAREMLRSGWPEGIQKLDDISRELNLSSEAAAVSIAADVTGDWLDVGTYLTGNPECFNYLKYAPGPTRELNILVHSGVLSDTSADKVITRGAAIMAIIDELSKSYILNITICNRAFNISVIDDLSFFLHLDTKNNYSRDLLAYCIVNPSFHRRIVFAARAIASKDFDCSVGGTAEMLREHQKILNGIPSLYFEAIETHLERWKTTESAKKYALETIDEFNKQQNERSY